MTLFPLEIKLDVTVHPLTRAKDMRAESKWAAAGCMQGTVLPCVVFSYIIHAARKTRFVLLSSYIRTSRLQIGIGKLSLNATSLLASPLAPTN